MNSTPGLVNFIVSMDQSEKQLLILYLVGPETRDLFPGRPDEAEDARHRPAHAWIKPAEMAAMIPIECKARDGLLLRGYVTLPPGRLGRKTCRSWYWCTADRGRGMCGVSIRSSSYLASRGYAVLQINYRGSTGNMARS